MSARLENTLLDKSKISSNRRRMSGLSAQARSRPKSSITKSNPPEEPDDGHVRVAVRCRPLSEKELADGHESIVEFESKTRIVVHDTSASPGDQLGTKSDGRRNISHVYDFDAVFDCKCSQRDVYETVCEPIVNSVLAGYNGTIFAYGQTGTGKTYTMEGINRRRERRKSSSTTSKSSSSSRPTTSSCNTMGSSAQRKSSKIESVVDIEVVQNSPDNKDTAGIMPRTFEQIFNHVANNTDVQFLIRASYLEIYQEEIHDLLRKDTSIKLELHERPDCGVYVKDLTSFVCKSISEIERVMKVGNQNRIVAATDMNEHSSRSHAIFMITVEQLASSSSKDSQRDEDDVVTNQTSSNDSKDKKVIKVGKLNLVDLAGSERQRKTNSSGQRQRESIKINLSLSALGNVINSLMKINNQQDPSNDQQQSNNNSNNSNGNVIASSHTPYRDSKLTRLLQDSLGGNAKTLMVANIGPANYNYDETINTLNYASRAKCIRNKPRVNEDPKDALLRKLQKEIDDLKAKLETISANSQKSLSSAKRGNGKLINNDDQDINNVAATDDDEGGYNNSYENAEVEFMELKQKLSLLQNKLLNNNNINSQDDPLNAINHNLLQGYTRDQELELEKSRVALVNHENREKAIRDELERREEAELLAKESFSSIQQEVDVKKNLIRQILLKIKTMRDKLDSSQKSYRLELDELDQLQYVLQKELKLKCLILDNYIPNNHVNQLLSRIIYDDKRNTCSIEQIDLPLDYCNLYINGQNDNDDADGGESDQLFNFKTSDIWQLNDDCIRPKSEFERLSETIYPNNIRYKFDNIIEPKLDFELIEHSVDTQSRRRLILENQIEYRDKRNPLNNIQNLIDSALDQHEPDIVI